MKRIPDSRFFAALALIAAAERAMEPVNTVINKAHSALIPVYVDSKPKKGMVFKPYYNSFGKKGRW